MANKPRSGGPKTEAGKARSSQNARKHGLLTEKIFILQTEDPAEWQKLQDTWIAKLGPKDDIELLAVNRIAFAQWRMHRLWAIETAAIDKEMDDQFPAYEARYGENGGDGFLRTLLGFEAFAAKEHGAELMHRYQAHLERCYTGAVKSFMDLRTNMKVLNELEVAAAEADVEPRQHEKVSQRDAEPRNEPANIEQNQQIREITKRTGPDRHPIPPSASAEPKTTAQRPPTPAEHPPEGDPSHEKAA